MTINPVGWFEIYVDDMERARGFYEKVLDLSLSHLEMPSSPDAPPADKAPEMWAFPADETTVGAAGALVRMDGVAAGGNSVMVYFKCEDCSNEEARVAGAGGQIRQGKTSLGPYGFMSIVADTEGNVIGLHSML